ncbi:hypothetical protein ACR6U3_004208 [Yersinia enterocolitica]
MKWTNRIITGLVIVLLTVLVLLLIGIMFYNSDKKMEIGSLTDWISAGANICMAGAAVYAAINAKDWIKDKHNSAGYDHVTKLMADYDIVLLKMHRFYFYMRELQKLHVEFPSVQKDIEDHVYTILPLQDRLNACRRFNVKNKIDLATHFDDIVTFYNLCLDVHGALGFEDIRIITDAYTKLDQQYNKVENFKNSLETDVKSLFSFT